MACVLCVQTAFWGGFQGGQSLQSPMSGIGSSHNAYLLDHPQKSVLRAPFICGLHPMPQYRSVSLSPLLLPLLYSCVAVVFCVGPELCMSDGHTLDAIVAVCSLTFLFASSFFFPLYSLCRFRCPCHCPQAHCGSSPSFLLASWPAEWVGSSARYSGPAHQGCACRVCLLHHSSS
jgi:hypothetical protein